MKFGQYELLERIAMGGMAEVYKGRVVGAEGFEKLVAIKRILPDLSADERFVTMLLTEARIHSALSHRNIVQIHDLGMSEEGEYFIVLEYVEGYDLRAIMESIAAEGEIIPEALSLHIAAEVAQGLHFAHDLRGADGQPLGLIHRDVSPSNVLISFAGEVKLSDFGLAKRRHDRSVVGTLKGNLIYMSPEQARQAPLDRRTDVFSLGAMLFELLTGKRLREITDEMKGWGEIAAGVVRSARSVRPDLPEPFEALLNQALAADPARRFADAGAFGAAIRQVLSQMNMPVGPADLQALLGIVSPPRKLRNELERSKVIRLAPESVPPAKRTITGRSVVPLPVTQVGNADVTPPPPRPPRPAARGGPLASEDEDMPPTPPPVAGWQAPAPSRRPAASGHKTLPLGGGGAPPLAATPPAATPPRRRQPTPVAATPPGPIGRSPLARSAPGAKPSTAAGPSIRNHQRAADLATPPPRSPHLARTLALPGAMPGPTPPPDPGPTPPPDYAAARRTPPSPAPVAARGWAPRPAPPRAPAFAPAAAEVPVLQDFPPRAHRPTARIQTLPTGLWRPVAVTLAAVVVLAACAVHVAFIPLEVLFSWRKPAALYVQSEPPGGTAKLDGVPLGDPTPTKVPIKRDRLDHVLEVALPGFRSARQIVRYDRSVALSFVIPLQKESDVLIQPVSATPAPSAEPAAADAGVASDR
jgi:serine/threonine protein kinase